MKWSPWLQKGDRSSNKKLGYFAIFSWKHGWNRSRKGNQHSTIQLKLNSVRWYRKRYLGVDLAQSPDFKILLQGIKRLSEPVHKKQPITPAFLRVLYRSINLSKHYQRLLWGSILIGFFFLLRRSEYLRIRKIRHVYCLKSKDAFFSDSRGREISKAKTTSVTIGLPGAKNDQYGRGAWRAMHTSGDPILCPVKALRHIRRARRSMQLTQTPYMCATVDAVEVAQVFKQVARLIGVPATSYSTHSIRIGGATALLNGGADNLAIKLLGSPTDMRRT